jgi:hypothetical protein
MTNSITTDPGAATDPTLGELAHIGGRRRPVKIVEHPAFRTSRVREALEAPFTVLRVPVAKLNAPAARPHRDPEPIRHDEPEGCACGAAV